MNGTNDDKGFVFQLHMRAQQKAQEYTELLHELQRLEVRIERTKQYVEQLNNFLVAEGQKPIHIRAISRSQSPVGKPGNRSKRMPVRKVKWEGMSINDIIIQILNNSPDFSFHPSDIIPLIYEIESEPDVKMVLRNVRTTMQRGVRDGRWERTGRAKFKAKVNEKQGTLANA